MSYTDTIIAHNHHTNIYPLLTVVVEYIRIGLTVGDACAAGIKRLIDMHPTDGDGDGLEGPTMYERGGLTVGVVAMDAQGNVGAGTLDYYVESLR